MGYNKAALQGKLPEEMCDINLNNIKDNTGEESAQNGVCQNGGKQQT